MSIYIGLISDTHGVLSQEFVDFLRPVDVIWHAGDWGGGPGFVKQFQELKPVLGVYGNCDGLDVRQEFPEYQLFTEEGLRILMTHVGGSPGHYYPRAKELIKVSKPDIFVCGHSHILKVCRDEGANLMYINPGAAGLQGWQVFRTALRFKLTDGKIEEMEVFNLERSPIARNF